MSPKSTHRPRSVFLERVPSVARLASVVVLCLAAPACSSSSLAVGGVPLELNGAYEASGGDISEITFTDASHYFLWSSPCSGSPHTCLHTGSYALNAASSELALTDAATGTTTTIPFKAGATRPLGQSLATVGLSESSTVDPSALDLPTLGGLLLVGDAGPLTQDAAPPPPTALTTSTAVALLTSFSSGLVVFTTKQFQMHPGVERLAQHALRTGDGSCTDTTCVEQQSIDWLNAYWLARMSEFAYLDHDDLTQALASVGLKTDGQHLQFFDDASTDTHAFYVTTAEPSGAPALTDPSNTASPDVAILSFRGTDPKSIINVNTDLNAWPNTRGSSLGTVDDGFFRALTSVWGGSIQPYLAERHSQTSGESTATRTGAELYFTGHSLGAALATLALAQTVTDPCGGLDTDCTRPYTPVSALYNYGSPRTGSTTFADNLADAVTDRTPLFRFVHCIPSDGYDIVTTVPPAPLYRHLTTDTDETMFEVFVEDGASQASVGVAPPDDPKHVALTDLDAINDVHDINHYAATIQTFGGPL
jgi:hypothetical protein